MPSGRGALHAGSIWRGSQRSGRTTYELTIKIDALDLPNSTLVGTMTIYGLTPALDRLCTHFEGEIVGHKFGWETGKWGANSTDDWNHWNRLKGGSTHLEEGKGEQKRIFMRWKEQFVIPQSTQIYHNQSADLEFAQNGPDNVHGASYAGFYYISLDFDPDSSQSLDPRSSEYPNADTDARADERGMERRSSAPGEFPVLPLLDISHPLILNSTLTTALDDTNAPPMRQRHRRYSTGSPHRPARQTYAEIVKSSLSLPSSYPSSLSLPSPSPFIHHAENSDYETDDEPVIPPNSNGEQPKMPLPGDCKEDDFPLPIITSIVREVRGHRRRLMRRNTVPSIVVLPPAEESLEIASDVPDHGEEGGMVVRAGGTNTDEIMGEDASLDNEERESKAYSALEDDDEEEDTLSEEGASDYRSRRRARMASQRTEENFEEEVDSKEVVNHWGFDSWSKATVRPLLALPRSQELISVCSFVDDRVRIRLLSSVARSC